MRKMYFRQNLKEYYEVSPYENEEINSLSDVEITLDKKWGILTEMRHFYRKNNSDKEEYHCSDLIWKSKQNSQMYGIN